MKYRLIAERWAKALFNAEKDSRKGLESTQQSLHVMIEDAKIFKLLLDPRISKEEKVVFISKLFKNDNNQKLVRFLNLLIDKDRVKCLREITHQHGCLVKKHIGLQEAVLTTASSTDNSIQDELRDHIQDSLRKTVKILPEIDSSLIGGATLVIENRMIDGSIKGKLDRLKEKLSKDASWL